MPVQLVQNHGKSAQWIYIRSRPWFLGGNSGAINAKSNVISHRKCCVQQRLLPTKTLSIEARNFRWHVNNNEIICRVLFLRKS
jgi:hypothetical protein